jgi:cephalosporin-C deacetylase
MKHHVPLLIFIFISLFNHKLFSQPVVERVKVIVAPHHSDWTYKTNEKVIFNVSVLRDGNLVKGVKLVYEIGLEKMDPSKKDSLVLANGSTTIDGGSLKSPGFLRCVATVMVDEKKYRGFGTAGVSPLTIQPTVENPADFVKFWEEAKQEAAKIPLDTKMTLLPERCTEKVNVYHVSVQNFKVGSRLYGILCVPKGDGKFPALLKVPGAGVRAYAGDVTTAAQGIITFEIGIHGIPVTMDPGVYVDLGSTALNGYFNFNLDSRDRYYYKKVYLGCVRANDLLTSLPQFDGTNLGVAGGSQGGALSIVTAALDPRVKYLASFYPALSDVTGYLKGRAGGWPHLFSKPNVEFNNTKQKLETVKYYDVVNFARQLKVQGFYSWGFNDETCPPTSMYSAYNVITAPKELYLELETGHWTYWEQREKFNDWIVMRLLGK